MQWLLVSCVVRARNEGQGIAGQVHWCSRCCLGGGVNNAGVDVLGVSTGSSGCCWAAGRVGRLGPKGIDVGTPFGPGLGQGRPN
jgi:hypothetical protein